MEHKIVWTREMENAMEQMLADASVSYRVIAEALSTRFGVSLSKNACIGKAQRMGLPARTPGFQRIVQPPPRRKYTRKDAPIPPAIPPRSKDGSISIYQLGQGDCHWPLGDITSRPPFRYCGKESKDGSPWCEEHYGRAYPMARLRSA